MLLFLPFVVNVVYVHCECCVGVSDAAWCVKV